MRHEASKPYVEQDPTITFHEHSGILLLTVLEAFSNDFSVKKKKIVHLPLDVKKAWKKEQIYCYYADVELKGTNV